MSHTRYYQLSIPQDAVPMEKLKAFADSCNCKLVRNTQGVAMVPRESNVVRIRPRPNLKAVPSSESDKTLA